MTTITRMAAAEYEAHQLSVYPVGADKPLAFHFRAPEFDVRDLGLPPPRDDKHAQAQGSTLLDLVLEAQWQDRDVSYSRRREWYAQPRRYRGTAYTFDRVVPFVDLLAAEGLIEYWKAPPGSSGRLQSTMRAIPALVAAMAPVSFIYEIGETVRLRDADKQPKDYSNTDQALRFRRNLAAINEALGSVSLTLPGAEPVPHGVRLATKNGVVFLRDHRNQVFRVFNEDFRHGGRMYGHDVQQLPKTSRERLLIDGEPVVEPDYPHHHPRMLYALQGALLTGDPYVVDGFERDLGKIALNTLINALDGHSAMMAIAQEVERRDRDDPGYQGWPTASARRRAHDLIDTLKNRHPRIAACFHTGFGTRLQYLDSLMAERVLLALRKRGIAAIPVHDSFVVPERHASLTRETMQQSFTDVMRQEVA
jgi:hypothetical protein